MFKGTVSTGSTIAVTFTAAIANGGSSSLLTGFVPSAPGGATGSQFVMVAPGGGRTLTSVVPGSLALDIRVDVPAPGDGGTLEVFENGVLKDRDVVGDVNWTYAVI